jgi:hypothetical protein
MGETGVRSLVAMITVYSLFEYLLKRILWCPKGNASKWFRRALMQGCWLFGIMLIGTLGLVNVRLVVAYALLALVYIGYESFWQQKSVEEKKLLLEQFLLKQFLFCLLLFTIWKFTSPLQLQDWYLTFEGFILSGVGSFALWLQQKFVAILLIVSTYLFMIDGGTNIVRGILAKFPNLQLRALQSNHTDGATMIEKENVGEWIGIMERWITLSFVLTSSFTAIAFALTAKSIARFKEMDNKSFAEYYLLGTSASIIVAIIAGLIVKSVLDW